MCVLHGSGDQFARVTSGGALACKTGNLVRWLLLLLQGGSGQALNCLDRGISSGLELRACHSLQVAQDVLLPSGSSFTSLVIECL